MISNQERAKVQRNIEYQILQNKLENSEKSKRIEWWKDKNEPDIKPYSVSSRQFSTNRQIKFSSVVFD
jgi:hypothetical protein